MGSFLPYIIKPVTRPAQSKNRGYSCAAGQASAKIPAANEHNVITEGAWLRKFRALHDLTYLVSRTKGHATKAGSYVQSPTVSQRSLLCTSVLSKAVAYH